MKTNWTESKTIPLKLCYLCRNLNMSDPEKRTVELHSPDGKSSCNLRFPDSNITSDWFSMLHSIIVGLTANAISEANQIMSTAPNQREVRHMGWVAEQVRRKICIRIQWRKVQVNFYQVLNRCWTHGASWWTGKVQL